MYNSPLFSASSSFDGGRSVLEAVTNHMLDLMKLKSGDLYEHALRVGNYAGATAVYMRLPANEITDIRYAGILHDIGLIAMPNDILAKKPYLSRRELSLYKKHPDLGANMLESSPECLPLIPFIRYHHENWDGTGFPKHLKNVNIPLGARIISVCSYFDSTIYSAPDFKTKTKTEVTRDIFSGSGILFDPEVITAFIKVIFHSSNIAD